MASLTGRFTSSTKIANRRSLAPSLIDADAALQVPASPGTASLRASSPNSYVSRRAELERRKAAYKAAFVAIDAEEAAQEEEARRSARSSLPALPAPSGTAPYYRRLPEPMRKTEADVIRELSSRRRQRTDRKIQQRILPDANPEPLRRTEPSAAPNKVSKGDVRRGRKGGKASLSHKVSLAH